MINQVNIRVRLDCFISHEVDLLIILVENDLAHLANVEIFKLELAP